MVRRTRYLYSESTQGKYPSTSSAEYPGSCADRRAAASPATVGGQGCQEYRSCRIANPSSPDTMQCMDYSAVLVGCTCEAGTRLGARYLAVQYGVPDAFVWAGDTPGKACLCQGPARLARLWLLLFTCLDTYVLQLSHRAGQRSPSTSGCLPSRSLAVHGSFLPLAGTPATSRSRGRSGRRPGRCWVDAGARHLPGILTSVFGEWPCA